MPSSTIHKRHFDSISDCIDAFKQGEFLVVLDAPSRENEADLIIAAQDVSSEQMGFMIYHSSGLICTPISSSRADFLSLPLMVSESQDFRRTAYTISIDAADETITTGISAHDRALTCRVVADPVTTYKSLRRPGHILPLRGANGGIRVRQGHTEAALEFCRLAGKTDAAVICELVDKGSEVAGQAMRLGPSMLRGQKCVDFAQQWGLKICTIEDLVDHVEAAEA